MDGQTLLPPIQSKRLILRTCRANDLAPFAAMCADPRVMEFFPGLIDRNRCNRFIDGLMSHLDEHGFTFWAMEERATGRFAGFTGLSWTDFDADFTPAVEIGWRLPFEFWGRGLASEAALASLRYGFKIAGLDEIIAITAEINRRSRVVMERIGMKRDADGDFDHPHVTEGQTIKRHVLYRIRADEYRDRVTLTAPAETIGETS